MDTSAQMLAMLQTLMNQNADIQKRLDAVEAKGKATKVKVKTTVSASEASETASVTTSVSSGGGGAKRTRKGTKNVCQGKRCCAIAWNATFGEYDGWPIRCSANRKGDTEFCGMHLRKALETEDPCSYNSAGQKVGLFLGRVADDEFGDNELGGTLSDAPFQDKDGFVCTIWSGPPSLVEKRRIALEGGAKFHPNSKEGKTKVSRVPKKEGGSGKGSDGAKKAKSAPKKTAFAFFCDDHREEFKELVMADEPDLKGLACFHKTTRLLKEAWDELSEDDKRPYLEKEANSDPKKQLATAEDAVVRAIMEVASAGEGEGGAQAEEESEEEADPPATAEEDYEAFEDKTGTNFVCFARDYVSDDWRAKRGDVYTLKSDEDGDAVPDKKVGVMDFATKTVSWNSYAGKGRAGLKEVIGN